MDDHPNIPSEDSSEQAALDLDAVLALMSLSPPNTTRVSFLPSVCTNDVQFPRGPP